MFFEIRKYLYFSILLYCYKNIFEKNELRTVKIKISFLNQIDYCTIFFFLSLKYQFFTYTFLYLCMFIKMKVSFIFKVKTVKYLVKLFFNRKMIGRIDPSRWNTIFTTPRRTGRNENLHWSTCEPCIYCDRYHVPVL